MACGAVAAAPFQSKWCSQRQCSGCSFDAGRPAIASTDSDTQRSQPQAGRSPRPIATAVSTDSATDMVPTHGHSTPQSALAPKT